MYKKEETSKLCTSKEKEKLKQRLQSLFKQHELQQNKKQHKTSLKSQRKQELLEHHVGGEPEIQKKQKAKNVNKPIQSKQVKDTKPNVKETEKVSPKKPSTQNNENGLGNLNLAAETKKSKKFLKKLSKKQSPQDLPSNIAHPLPEKFKITKASKKKNKSKNVPAPYPQKQKKTHDILETHAPKNPVSNKVPLANGQPKQNESQKKKAKKRAAAVFNQDTANDSKKPKLITGESSEAKAPTKASKHKPKKPYQIDETAPETPGAQVNEEYDFNNISGFVNGGDFDSGSVHEEDSYWVQQDKDLYTDDPEYYIDEQQTSGEDTGGDTNYNSDNGEADDPYNYSDMDDAELDSNDPYDYSDYEEETEEEEERYSDFDEADYEQDEDSYDYSDSEFSSNCEEEQSYDFNDTEEDDDYKLPDNVPEDLIIHSGTATKRNIQPEDNVVFKDKKYCQIIELEEQEIVKDVQQPAAYKKEELLKLTYRKNHTVKVVTAIEGEESTSCSVGKDDCPKLVPIVDADGFQLYNANETEDEDEYEPNELNSDYTGECDDDSSMYSLGSEYSEINSEDADSLISEDINEKYLNRSDNDYYSTDDELLDTRKSVDLIDATECDYAGKNKHSHKAETDESLLDDDDVNQLPSQRLAKHVKVGSKGSILITTIIDQHELEIYNESLKDGELNKTVENLSDSSNSNITEVPSPGELNESQDSKLSQSDARKEIEKHTKLPATRAKLNKVQSLTNYNTVFCNAINANLVLVLLKDPFYIYGTVRLTLLAGTVEVYGHPLCVNQEVEVFSPRGCSVIEILAKSSENKKTSSTEKLKATLREYESNFILADLDNISNSYEAGKDAVVLMKRNEGTRKIVLQFKKFMNENVFPNLQNISMDRPLYNAEYLLRCIINTSATELKCLRLPDQWEQLALSEKSCVMLAGGKGVGKSTLLRYLINKHIHQHDRVLLIDLDIGQPEIFIPQTVSCSIVRKPLLGPGFFLNIQPEKAFALGHTNIALCPHKYVKAVLHLTRYCLSREDFKGIPWLINTMGYNKGFGLELISLIIKALPLTDVIQLQSKKDINNYDSLLFPHTVSQVPSNMFVENIDITEGTFSNPSYRLHVWQSAVKQESRFQKEWDMSPKDMRYAMLLTRLTEALQGHADWLADCKPLSAPLDQLQLVNLMDDHPPCSKDELAKSMEVNLVYLCHYENDENVIECLGIGAVRAIDYHVRQVYLLPAMAPSLLKFVNCLALGDMPLPNSIFTNQGSRVKNTAPFVYNTIEAKASKAVKQIYHRPRAFLSGKHKSLD